MQQPRDWTRQAACQDTPLHVTQAGRWWHSTHSHPAGQESYPIPEHIPGSP
jgi:hypothetical protein